VRRRLLLRGAHVFLFRLRVSEQHHRGVLGEHEKIDGATTAAFALVPDREPRFANSSQCGNDVSCKGVVRNRAARVRRCRREKLAGVSDPSDVYRFGGISEVKMMDCLAKLGRDVRIVAGPARRAAGGNVKVALG
jgi:hypothetical protein